MGTVFEEVIRKFNEETNITDAGRHFTPRDIVELIADLAFVPIEDQIKSTTYRIYDGACGTGGMLTVAEERIQRLSQKAGKKVSIHLYGQENADETYAIARADMLVKGEGSQANNIFFGSTISNDGFPGETFDFCLSRRLVRHGKRIWPHGVLPRKMISRIHVFRSPIVGRIFHSCRTSATRRCCFLQTISAK